MALTATEEALLRDLLAKQAQLIALANNETTITAKLGSTKATIDDLTAATTVADSDLMIIRQGGVDKKLPVSVVKSDLVDPIDLSSYAPLASPALTGAPSAPTAAAGTNTTQIATTAFVQSEKPSAATQAEMEAGTEAAIRSMSPLRVAQAIAAKAPGGVRGQVFTESGTFTVPPGVTAVKVRGCGGGGGSSTSNGGTTSFGAYCSATGGVNAGTTRAGGTATGGDLNITGGTGGSVASGTSSTGGAVGGADGGSTTAASTVLPRPSGLLGIYGCGGSGTSGGGGAGGYFERYITGLTPGASITVTIGAAGTGAGAGICIVEW